jgi:hypothetical protein
MNSGLFGYQNDAEQLRPFWEALRSNRSLFFDLAASQNPALREALGEGKEEEIETEIAKWVDFSLLPEFEKVAKYFHLTVYAGNTSSSGYTLTTFSPLSPRLKP